MITVPKSQIKELVDTIYQQTAAGKISWTATYDEETLECKLSKYIVRIVGHTPDDEVETYYWLQLRSETGEEIETIHPSSVPGLPIAAGITTYPALFEAIFEAARRSANGATDAIEDILSVLRKA